MIRNYFEIENLKCSYDKKDHTINDSIESKVVLEIEKLHIPRGEVVFIVGQSGCGKSTILETLGLMNNTIISANKFTIFPEDNISIDGRIVWKEKNGTLSNIRKKYYSFIFQDTNLMKNFTIWENAIIPQMIKGGTKKYEEILKIAYSKNEEWKEIKNKKKVGDLSGGQKQRLAFVRAFLPDFKIIFGDEPTGNLDPENADNLMKIVADEIKDTEKTAIIVSHSPELSVKYADRIIKIHKKERSNNEIFGLIDNDSVYVKQDNQWFQENKRLTNNELQILIKQ